MRRIKIILAVVAAVATMLVLAAPAMAQDTTFTPATFDGDTFLGSGDFGDGFVGGDFGDGFVDGFVDGDFGDCSFGCNDQFVISDPSSSIGGLRFG
jgi:hypothetical protein